MDVRCGRCGTEYDFDDALVSERGTTVKCTNCGHQFKVYPGGGGGAPERWIVRKASGRELVYTSLRDLQRAIAQRQVGPTDLLSRGSGQPLRPLGGIAELEPFFQAQGPAPAEAAQRTLLGVAPVGVYGSPDGHAREVPRPAAHPTPQAPGPQNTPGGIRGGGPPAGPTPGYMEESEPATVPRNAGPGVDPSVVFPMTAMSTGAQPQSLPNDQMSAAFRAYQDSYDDLVPSADGVPKRSALRWVVGIVVAGALAFIVGTIGVRFAKKRMPTIAAATTAVKDDRARKFLDSGDEDLGRGDFESAKENFDKASALAERDPSVLSALARLEAAQADQRWLAERLIDPKSKSEIDAQKAELDTQLARVKKAAADAAAVAPNDPAVLRVRIDALRLEGALESARELVGSLGSDASDPETAYVLGALDLAEPAPTWTSVVDRLRTAAAADRGFGRARAALVYALASSHAIDDARTELAKAPPSGPQAALVGRLRSFVDRLDAASPPGSSSAPSPIASGAPQAAASTPKTATASPGEGEGESAPRGMDFRKLLEDASSAKQGGDLARAEALYQAAQEQQPSNIEALAGLGDIARLRGNTTAAQGYYEAVLQQNPSYLPALMSSADLKWGTGDHPGAIALYKRVVAQADPGSGYAQRATARIAEAGSSTGSSTAPQKKEPPKVSDQPAPANPPSNENHIDTTDLPGFHQ